MTDSDRKIIESAGHAVEGLGRAIEGLGKLGLKEEAKELATQLKFMTKNLSWMLRTVSDRHSPSLAGKKD